MTKNVIIFLFALSVLSPGIGILIANFFKSGGDAAGKGMAAGLTILIFMFIASLAGGIISSILWACSKEPLPFWAKTMTVFTYLAPYIFVAITEYILPSLKK